MLFPYFFYCYSLIYDLGITETPDSDSESNCLIYKLYDPDLGGEEWNSESFGKSVSINGLGGSGVLVLVDLRDGIFVPKLNLQLAMLKETSYCSYGHYLKNGTSQSRARMEFGYSLKLNKCKFFE